MIHGKCLCGEITYTLASELLYLYHCHCHCVECRCFSGGSPIYSQAEQGGEFTAARLSCQRSLGYMVVMRKPERAA
jgi:hypothetical protein